MRFDVGVGGELELEQERRKRKESINSFEAFNF